MLYCSYILKQIKIMEDFILGAQTPRVLRRHTDFQIELKYPLAPLMPYLFLPIVGSKAQA